LVGVASFGAWGVESQALSKKATVELAQRVVPLAAPLAQAALGALANGASGEGACGARR